MRTHMNKPKWNFKNIKFTSILLVFLVFQILFKQPVQIGSSSPQVQASPAEQGKVGDLEFLDYYTEPCNEAEGTFIYRIAINLVKDPADGLYKGVAKFHNCPGGGRVLYYVTGTLQAGSTVLLTGDKMVGGGALFQSSGTGLPFTMDLSTGKISPQPISSVGNPDEFTKPVGFINMGTIAYTVQAETYIPLGQTSPATPSDASTVAMALDRNSSSYLGLPMGTYTWCYWWDVGDINNDSYLEYYHAYDTRPLLLDENSSTEPEMAPVVTLTAPPSSGELPGRCTTP